MTDDIHFTSATDLARRIRRRRISPETVVEAYLDRIADRNDRTNAYVTVLREEATERASEAARAVELGEPLGPLHGVPIALKDLFGLKEGVRHTYGSKPFEDHVAEETAVVVERLEAAGAIVLGKTNTPELGWGDGKTENLVFGKTGNPFDPALTAGGSSGGSAVAVADGMAALAQGSDAGGSVRIPASACGVVGFYPSFDRIPTGFRPDAFSAHTPFTQFGPLARTVEDAALFLDIVSGFHESDPLSHPEPETEFVVASRQSIEGLSIGYSPALGLFEVSPTVQEIVGDAVDAFETVAAVERADPPFDRSRQAFSEAFETFVAVTYATMAENLKELDGIDLAGELREQVTDSILEFIEIGRDTDAVAYRRADVVRTEAYDALRSFFDEYDVLVTPTLAVPPFDKDESPPDEIGGTSIDPRFDWFLTWIFNMTGNPAVTVPAGFTDDDIPVGLQIVGPRHDDETVLAAAETFERLRPWHDAYGGGRDA